MDNRKNNDNNENKVSYDELHKHVVNYSKNNDSESALFILEAFNKMIWLYVHLICDKNNFKLYKKRHRDFISLFCPRFVMLSADKWRTTSSVKNFLLDAAQYVTYIHRKYTPEDIYSECQIILLQMAKSYKVYDKPTFHTLVDRLYHKKLFSRLKQLASDPFVRKDNLEFDYNIADENSSSLNNCSWHGENSWYKDIEECENKIDYDLTAESDKTLLDAKNQELDIDWINGAKGNEIFKSLTRTEREILKYYYYDNLTDKEVGERIGFCMSTINKKRNKILEKIKLKMEEIKNEESKTTSRTNE